MGTPGRKTERTGIKRKGKKEMSRLNAEIKKLEEFKEKKGQELEKIRVKIIAAEEKLKEKEFEKLKVSENADFDGLYRVNEEIKQLEEEYNFYLNHEKDLKEKVHIGKDAYEAFKMVMYAENREQEAEAVKQIFKKLDEIKKIISERLEFCTKTNIIKDEYQEAAGISFYDPGVNSNVAEYFKNVVFVGLEQKDFEV